MSRFMKPRKLSQNQLFGLVEERLALQSTRRNLEAYRLPRYSWAYFQSPEFADTFKNWLPAQKENFLKSLAGEFWKNIESYIQPPTD